MGNIPPCVDNIPFSQVGIYGLVHTYACDSYAVPHIVNVFWLAIITRDPWFAFVMAGLSEIFEAFAQVAFANFLIFVGAEGSYESVGMVLIEDWLIQGGIGALLGLMFIASFPGPRMLRFRDLFRMPVLRVGRFVFYLFIVFLLCVPGTAIHSLTVGASEFPIGILLYAPIAIVSVGFMVLFPVHKRRWHDYTSAQQWDYWLTALGFTVVIGTQTAFDYLQSSAIQSWLWSFVFAVYLFARAVYRYRTYGYVYSPEGYDPFKTD